MERQVNTLCLDIFLIGVWQYYVIWRSKYTDASTAVSTGDFRIRIRTQTAYVYRSENTQLGMRGGTTRPEVEKGLDD